MRCSDGQLSSDIQSLALQVYCYATFKHPRLDEVVKRLEAHQLLLETDSPYLLPPEHNRCEYNTHFECGNRDCRPEIKKNLIPPQPTLWSYTN